MLGVSMKRVQRMSGVHTVRGGRVELTGDVHLQVDGEYAGRLPASIDIVPAAITLLMPLEYKYESAFVGQVGMWSRRVGNPPPRPHVVRAASHRPSYVVRQKSRTV